MRAFIHLGNLIHAENRLFNIDVRCENNSYLSRQHLRYCYPVENCRPIGEIHTQVNIPSVSSKLAIQETWEVMEISNLDVAHTDTTEES